MNFTSVKKKCLKKDLTELPYDLGFPFIDTSSREMETYVRTKICTKGACLLKVSHYIFRRWWGGQEKEGTTSISMELYHLQSEFLFIVLFTYFFHKLSKVGN